MPPTILAQILKLAEQGAKVIVQDAWPLEVPGFHRKSERRTDLLALESKNTSCLHVSGSILPILTNQGVLQERMTLSGLRYVRRSHSSGYHYFIVNRSEHSFEGILPLAVSFQSAVILDPWVATKSSTAFPEPIGKDHGISLRLAPGQSIIIRTFTDQKIEGPPWTMGQHTQRETPIEGPWQIDFIEGGPVLPEPVQNGKLGSWTNIPGTTGFSGTARYTATFDIAGPLSAFSQLDLGRVANTARISLNGKSLGISWCAPHLIDVTELLQIGKNLLEIEVTNLAANRIADLDRRNVPWKRFHEINFVNIDYKLFDASAWPAFDSGLIGPVKLKSE